MCKQGTRPDLDRVQPTAIGSPPDSFRLREMASVPDSASVPSAERERAIEKTDELRRLKNARNRKFESISLQQTVRLSPASTFEGREPGFRRGFARMAWRPRRQRRRDVLISLRRAATSLSGRIPVPQ